MQPKLRDVKNIEAVPLISLSEVFPSGFCISTQGCRIEVKKRLKTEIPGILYSSHFQSCSSLALQWHFMTSHGFSATGSSRRHQLGCSYHQHAPTWVRMKGNKFHYFYSLSTFSFHPCAQKESCSEQGHILWFLTKLWPALSLKWKSKLKNKQRGRSQAHASCSPASALSYSLAWDAFPHSFLVSGAQSFCSIKTWHLRAEWEGSHRVGRVWSCSGKAGEYHPS